MDFLCFKYYNIYKFFLFKNLVWSFFMYFSGNLSKKSSIILGFVIIALLSSNVYASTEEIDKQQNNHTQKLFHQLQQQSSFNSFKSYAFPNQNFLISSTDNLYLKNENPCFKINNVRLSLYGKDYHHFIFLEDKLNKKSAGIINQCIGANGLQQILSLSQNSLIEKGFVTSKVLIKPQDLNTGTLVLSVIAGKVANIYREYDDKNINLHNAITVNEYDVLNLRDLEQSSENLKNPTNIDVKIHIEPTRQENNDKNIGLSDLVIKRQKKPPISLQTIFNNYGNYSTGVYQGGIGLTLNEPLWSNDKFYVQYMESLNGLNHTPRPTTNQNLYINYQYPYKTWKLGLTYNRSHYTQSLKGFNHDPIYEGISQRKQVHLEKSLHRTANAKLSAYVDLAHKKSENLIDGLEVLVQKRRTTTYGLGIAYENINSHHNVFNLNIGVNKGGGAFKALPTPERFYSDVESRPLIWLFDGRYRMPFQIGKHQFGYNTHFNAQYSQDNLSSNDQFTIGDRQTVRGFDGKKLLAGNKGLMIGQEIYYQLPTQISQQLYFAIDKGFVSKDTGTSSDYIEAMGSVLGYRMGLKHLNLDAYVGQPLQDNHLSDKTNAGVQVAFSF